MYKYLSLFDKKQPSYLIITAALLKAEVYWVCSAISCLYHSTTTNRLASTHITAPHKRNTAVPDQIIITAVDDPSDNQEDPTQLNAMEQHTAHRRLSLPLLIVGDDDDSSYNGIRYRPSAADEMTGTTCPPVWWQKAKIKLSHSRNNSLQKTTTHHSSVNTTTLSPQEQTVDETCQPVLDYLETIHSRHSAASSTAISQYSLSSSFEKKHHHRAKEMMTKIKTRIVKISRHRRGTSLDLDKLKL